MMDPESCEREASRATRSMCMAGPSSAPLAFTLVFWYKEWENVMMVVMAAIGKERRSEEKNDISLAHRSKISGSKI